MNRIDRAIGILLLLRSQKTAAAREIAARYEVSVRTVYRDVETLAELGIPVYAEMGRHGGFRLVDGYFMPPVSFSFGEAMSLFIGLAFARSLRVQPAFDAGEDGVPPRDDAGNAERKLLAAMPDHLKAQLMRTRELIGIESLPADLLHPERGDPQRRDRAADERVRRAPQVPNREARHVGTFLTAIVEQKKLRVRYHSPYGATGDETFAFTPAGVLWDRERWYLIGKRDAEIGIASEPAKRRRASSRSVSRQRLLRADRVVALAAMTNLVGARNATGGSSTPFDVRAWLGRRWLGDAMKSWAQNAPVRIRLSARLAERLAQDWFWQHAMFERDATHSNAVVMTYGEDDRELVYALVRWLGDEAELLEPRKWRAAFGAALRGMATLYE